MGKSGFYSMCPVHFVSIECDLISYQKACNQNKFIHGWSTRQDLRNERFQSSMWVQYGPEEGATEWEAPLQRSKFYLFVCDHTLKQTYAVFFFLLSPHQNRTPYFILCYEGIILWFYYINPFWRGDLILMNWPRINIQWPVNFVG